MKREARDAWWSALPVGVQQEIDGHVLRDSLLSAVRLVVDVGLVRDGIGIGTAQLIVGDRYEHHGDRVARQPHSPLDLESLALKAAGLGERVVAVEAVWDGDTVHDWFVVLLAVTEDPAAEHSLGVVYSSTADRHLGEDVDTGRRPRVAVAAERAGRALAEHLGVPFHFASPDEPDDEAPRRRP
ncbi:hypothetical protein [Kitasatospora sp. NPDC004289]